jgi:hypothetical protein
VRAEGGGSTTAGSPGFQFSTPPEKPQVGPSNQCLVSVTFWCASGFGSADPHLLLMDPDPIPFFSDFKDAKKNCQFFLLTYPQAFYLQS